MGKFILFIICLVAIVYYFFWMLPPAIDQGVMDFKEWRQKPDTVITIKNGRADTTIIIKK
jgi:hypothetical protein